MANTPWVDKTSEEILSPHISGLQDGVKNIEQALDMGTEAVSEYGLILLADADGAYRIAEALGKRNWLTDPAPVIEQLIDTVWTTITTGFTIDHACGALVFTADQAGESFRASFTRVKNVSVVLAGNDVVLGAGASKDGNNAVVIGRDATANNSQAIAIGLEANYEVTAGESSVAIGYRAKTTAIYGIAIGYYASEQERGIVIGASAATTGWYGVAIGYESGNQSDAGVALGRGAKTGNTGTGTGDSHIAIGYGASTQVNSSSNFDYTIAIGRDAQANSDKGIAIGHITRQTGGFGVAIGNGAEADAYGICIGMAANDNEGSSSIVIGRESNSTENYSITLGTYAGSYGYSGITIGYEAQSGNWGDGSGVGHIAIGDGASTYVDSSSNIDGAIAIGKNASTDGENAVAIGFGATGSDDSVVIGKDAYGGASPGNSNVVIGKEATIPSTGTPYYWVVIGTSAAVTTGSHGGVLIGSAAETTQSNVVVIGGSATSKSRYGVAIGEYTWIGNTGTGTGNYHIAIGYNATTYVDSSSNRNSLIAIGYGAGASHTQATAIGRNASASALDSLAVGDGASASAEGAVALGVDASASGDHSSAIGAYSSATQANQLVLGISNSLVEIPGRLDLKRYSETVTTANTGTSYTIDMDNGTVFNLTLTGNCTFTFSNPAASGKASSFTLILKQDGTGGRTVTWPTSVKWAYGVEPDLFDGAGDVDILTFFTIDGGTTWYGFLAGGDLS